MVDNDRTITLKIKRRDVIHLMVACSHMVAAWSKETKRTTAMTRAPESLAMWQMLHDEIDTQLKESDLKHKPRPDL